MQLFFNSSCNVQHDPLWPIVTKYDDMGLGQHWHGHWLAVWRHHTITWTNVKDTWHSYESIIIRKSESDSQESKIENSIFKLTHYTLATP